MPSRTLNVYCKTQINHGSLIFAGHRWAPNLQKRFACSFNAKIGHLARRAPQPCSCGRSTPTSIAAAGSRRCSRLRRAARRPLIRAIASGLGARPMPVSRPQTTGARAGSFAAVPSDATRACSIDCLARKRNSERRSEQRSEARDIGRSRVRKQTYRSCSLSTYPKPEARPWK
jgi:hypothetical protein